MPENSGVPPQSIAVSVWYALKAPIASFQVLIFHWNDYGVIFFRDQCYVCVVSNCTVLACGSHNFSLNYFALQFHSQSE